MGKVVKELQVAALCNGTAIDHIPSKVLFKVVSLLKLETIGDRITIGNNLESHKTGSKGIIKVSDRFFEEHEINKLAVIAPNIVLNVIKDYVVVEKKRAELPETILDIVKCKNPKCITNNEPMSTRFLVTDKENVTLRCHYCDIKMKQDEVELR